MRLLTTRYTPNQGWDHELDATLDSKNTLLILFGSSYDGPLGDRAADRFQDWQWNCSSDPQPLQAGFFELRRVYPNAVWTGCSSAGDIYGEALEENSLTVAVLAFEKTTLRVARASVDQTHAAETGQSLAAQLAAPDLQGVFVLSDGLAVNGSELTRGLSESLPANVVITGGLAGDGAQFRETWVLVNQHPCTRQVVAVGLYGDHVGMAYGSRGGWEVFGQEREVTRAAGNVLYSLNGQSALALYKKQLGEHADELPAAGLRFPLSIRNEQEEDGYTVRTILAVDEATQSITFAGDVPEGAMVQMMRASTDRLVAGAADAAAHMNFRDYAGGPLLTVAISCVGRRLVLNQHIDDEIHAVHDHLPPDSALIGFYSYGELSPLKSGRCDLHNQTMTLTSFWEK